MLFRSKREKEEGFKGQEFTSPKELSTLGLIVFALWVVVFLLYVLASKSRLKKRTTSVVSTNGGLAASTAEVVRERLVSLTGESCSSITRDLDVSPLLLPTSCSILDLVLLATLPTGGVSFWALSLGVLRFSISGSGAFAILFCLLHSTRTLLPWTTQPSRLACHSTKLIFCLVAYEQTARVFRTKHRLRGILVRERSISTLSCSWLATKATKVFITFHQ